jgi:hypothetical protein
MATTLLLMEVLQPSNPEMVVSLKQILASVFQASGSSNRRVDVPKEKVHPLMNLLLRVFFHQH